jgi:hypothetical protein
MTIEFAPVPAKSVNFAQLLKAEVPIVSEGISGSSSMKVILAKFAQLRKAHPPIERA